MEPSIQQKAIRYQLNDDGRFPNNDTLCVILYPNAIVKPEDELGAYMEHVFRNHRWENAWRNGILNEHHYHSTAHEVLGIYAGTVKVQLGGPKGITLDLEPGDVLVIPAGVAHINLESSKDFRCVGAYPEGQDYDMNYGKTDERPRTDRQIKNVPNPSTDPVYGNTGPLFRFWKLKQ